MSYFFNALNTTAIMSSNALVDLTKGLNDSPGQLAVDRYMDSFSGTGHRIKHGHDLTYLPKIFDRYGAEGVCGYLRHNLKDLMSPHGVPLPFAAEIRKKLGLSYSESIDWLSINIGKLFSGTISAINSAFLIHSLVHANTTGVVSSDLILNVTLSGAVKIGSSLIAPNPITFISGLVDIGALCFTLTAFYLDTGTIPVIFERTTTEILFSGTIKGVLLSLAIGIPIEAFNSYSHYKNGNSLQDVKKDFMRSIIKLALLGGAAGFSSSAIFLMTSNLLIASTGGLFIYLCLKKAMNNSYSKVEPRVTASFSKKQREPERHTLFLRKLNFIPDLA